MVDRYETVYRAGVNQMRGYENLDLDRQNKLRWGLENLRFARLCAYLRHRQSIAEAGHSILIFQVSDNDLRTALDGPSPQ